MGRKVKKTKWRTLEIPAPGTTYTENGGGSKWDDGQRTPSTNNNNNINHNHNNHNHNNNNNNNNTTNTTTTTNTNTNINSHQHQYERTNVRRKPSPSPSPTAKSAHLYSSKQDIKGLVEDEYTKITTPRQDVLFKKGYLTRRKVPETISENSVDQNNDGEGIAQDCSSNEDFSNCANGDESVQFMCPGPQSYIDPSALYYGGGYEIYDPYTGNVTVIVGPGAGQYPANASCQPVLTSVPCRPVPLQPVQWFNPVPSSDWCCPYSPSDKRYSTDSQNGSGMGSESSGVPESPPEMIDETMNGNNGPVFPPSYVYPGYMFGASIYNVDDVNTQYYAPESPALSTSELTTSKRRRKKKRRRRTEAEDESESSFDDNCSRSISSTEFILDSSSHLPTESQHHHHDFEELFVAAECSSSSSIAAVPFPSFPHPNVNAPEFVPTSIELALSSLTNASNLADRDNRSSSNSVVGTCHDESPSKKTSVLNVYCGESYQERHHQKKRDDSESVSCSNNSDSGISSPGSEDISKNGFGQKESKAHPSDESGSKSKKSRSRKSTSGKTTKSKQANNGDETRKSGNHNQLKTITCIVPTYRESKRDARAGTGASNDEKRDSKKSTVNSGGKSAAAAKKATATAASSRNKEKKNETVIAPKSDSKRSTPEKKKGAKKVDPTEDVVAAAVDEQLSFEIHSQLVLDEDISGSSVDHTTTTPATTNEETDRTKMLNEYVKIEEKPMLVKLVDLNAEVRVSDDLMDEISTMSEFSSCRESAVPLEAAASDHRHFVELTAKQVVNEIIDRAEERVLSSMSCDKLQLPITEAVTKWLNEHGGLSVVTESVYDESRGADDEDETAAVACAQFSEKSGAAAAVESNKSKKSKQNCVIC